MQALVLQYYLHPSKMKRVKVTCSHPDCAGGKLKNGETCQTCHGTGHVYTYEQIRSRVA